MTSNDSDDPSVNDDYTINEKERELIAYILENAIGFMNSQAYQDGMDGDYRAYLGFPITVTSTFGAFIRELVDCVRRHPEQEADLEPKIQNAIDMIETIAQSDDDEVINDLTTGAYETIESSESQETFSTIVNRLGPHGRALWDEWMPLISNRKPDPPPPWSPKDVKSS